MIANKYAVMLILMCPISGLAAGQAAMSPSSQSNTTSASTDACGVSSCSLSISTAPWQWDGKTWSQTLNPGQVPSLGPTFQDQLSKLGDQTQQFVLGAGDTLSKAAEGEREWWNNLYTGAVNNKAGAAAALIDTGIGLMGIIEENPSLAESLHVTEPLQLGRDIFAPVGAAVVNGQFNKPTTYDSVADGARAGMVKLTQPPPLGEGLYEGANFLSSLNELAEEGAAINHPPVWTFDVPSFDLSEPLKMPLEPNASSQANQYWPFTPVNPSDVTIVDPPGPSGTNAVEIDASTAEQMILTAKQSRDSLISEQSQLSSQSADYDRENQTALYQGQQVLTQSEIRAQTEATLTEMRTHGLPLTDGNSSELTGWLQALGGVLNNLPRKEQIAPNTKGVTPPAQSTSKSSPKPSWPSAKGQTGPPATAISPSTGTSLCAPGYYVNPNFLAGLPWSPGQTVCVPIGTVQ